MTLEGSIVKLMSHLEKHTTEYLQNEVAVKQIKCIAVLKELQSLDLKSLTSIISVAGDINMFLAFSFESQLLEKITHAFLFEDDEDGAASDIDCLDMASEFINIIVGLCITEINTIQDTPILFSPPLVINEAKMIRQKGCSHLYTIGLQTEYGCLDINCVGPSDLFDDYLNYLEAK